MIRSIFKVLIVCFIVLIPSISAIDPQVWNGGSALTVTQEGIGTTTITVNGGAPYTLVAGSQRLQLNPNDEVLINAPGAKICEQYQDCRDYQTEDVHTLKMDSTYELFVFYGV